MAIIYGEMSPIDLKRMRINCCVRKTTEYAMIYMDECCEILGDSYVISNYLMTPLIELPKVSITGNQSLN